MIKKPVCEFLSKSYPDTTFHFDADPDPDPDSNPRLENLNFLSTFIHGSANSHCLSFPSASYAS